jgi:hypothetical protein
MHQKSFSNFFSFLILSFFSVILVSCSSSGGGSDDGSGTGPSPTIDLSTNVSVSEVISAAENSGTIEITGFVGGDAKIGDEVTIKINEGSPATGLVADDKTYSIDIPILQSYVSSGSITLSATVKTVDNDGKTGSATATFSFNIADIPIPTILLNTITGDGIVDASEASGNVTITGTVGGDAKVGDLVAITVNNVTKTGAVQSGNTFSIEIFGSSLVNDNDNTVVATVTTENNGNSGTASTTKTYSIDVSGGGNGTTLTCPDPKTPCYDIIYVRYPAEDPGDKFVSIPQGEKPYDIAAGADLMLLKQDGSETILVDCTVCSVMDPFISYDGKTVYYSFIEKAENKSASWIYKIHLDDPTYKPIRLTFDDGFDSVNYKGNQTVNEDIKNGHDQGEYRGIRDMAPVPLADGRLLFTSNRSALTTFHPFAEGVIDGSIQQLYVMDDHEGTAVTKELANMHQLETGNLHMIQHPFQLRDGRILFSTWQDVGTKQDGKSFSYAMTSLFTVHPDGSNLQQFTEPHDHHKNVDHFVSQLPGDDVVWTYYYPSFDYGFGLIMRAPVSSNGPDFLRNSIDQRYPYGNQYRISYREFDRKGMVSLTPHTTSSDVPAPSSSGKYSMPSVADNGNLLVAYSKGSVNHFNSACAPEGLCEALKSGIYLILNADGDSDNFITNPGAQLIKIKDSLAYNEIWPRAVLSYEQIYGQKTPGIINNLSSSLPDDSHLVTAEASSIVGTSSIYNREPLNDPKPDPFQSSKGREFHDGNWTVQGADAGVFSNDDIYGVRIVTSPAIPFTQPIDKNIDLGRWNSILKHLEDDRLKQVVARFGSYHGERWEILGEFPVKKSVTDGRGDPDTSWQAKIPSDTPFFIQTIDENSMTLVSELAWRALKPGEKRADCGGCHAHSVMPLDIATTQAGKNKPIVNIQGVNSSDPVVANGIWDLTLNSVPLLNDTGVTFEPGNSYGVEFNRDITPILNNRCVTCHSAGKSGSMFILDGSGGIDPWSVISGSGHDYVAPQRSKYIRIPQARQSLLVWAAWGKRLDGRTNADREFDVDYPTAHPATSITDKEKRTIARWVDLGGPIDFPTTDGFGYTDDYQLPIVNIYTPFTGNNSSTMLKVGFADAISGLNLSSTSVKYYKITANISAQLSNIANSTNFAADLASLKSAIAAAEQTVSINTGADIDSKNILSTNLSLTAGEYVVTVSVKDNAGNRGIATRRFTIQ